ncbi:C6 finger domain-containingprotein [Purpureocillium lavendulum]|uniref:C6 finger domain-containingprotein n=1 Tax=Purpureocillium lavendulum TaxID=1247861 RepID=A0AB34G1S3_9HYPO|nr:C6 finger domain-containingprotein [Purpureocillium lavendulum]
MQESRIMRNCGGGGDDDDDDDDGHVTKACDYTLRLVWGASKHEARRPSVVAQTTPSTVEIVCIQASRSTETSVVVPDVASRQLLPLPRYLPNGVPLPPRYRRLLGYFTEDILASLSCHPSIHEDLCRGLVPAALTSPHLLSACLALSAAGFLSRGLSEVDGIEISRVLGHLQHSGLALLRAALDDGRRRRSSSSSNNNSSSSRSQTPDETVPVTCLIWCLADVFACGRGGSSWRIHLRGIKALIDDNHAYRNFGTVSGVSRMAMKHLYLLYLSLQTLPYVPPLHHAGQRDLPTAHGAQDADMEASSSTSTRPSIDGFLGYSEELLHALQQINALSSRGEEDASASASAFTDASLRAQSDILLGKLKGMIRRDARTPLEISIGGAPLTDEQGGEFSLCHGTFQQATLVHAYRRLYRMPSGAPPIQAAVAAIRDMVSEMTQGRPCHTWVAMAMPLFTLGCEAFTPPQQAFVLDKIDKFEACLGSLHVRIIRQALEDIWRARASLGDVDGDLCASELLETLQYNIILF